MQQQFIIPHIVILLNWFEIITSIRYFWSWPTLMGFNKCIRDNKFIWENNDCL